MSRSSEKGKAKLEELRRVLHAFAECLEVGVLRWRHYISGLAIVGDAAALRRTLRKHKLELEQFDRLVSDEILPVLRAAAEGPDTVEAGPKTQQETARLVREALLTPTLQAEMQFNASAKQAVLRGIDWEVSTKVAERDIELTPGLAYATLRLEVEAESDPQARLLRDRSRYVFICGPAEIETLAEQMQALREAMRGAVGEARK